VFSVVTYSSVANMTSRTGHVAIGHVTAVGSTTNMTCTIPSPVDWFFKSEIQTKEIKIYNGYKLFGSTYINDSNFAMHSSVHNDRNLTTLTVRNTSTRDDGVYTCFTPENETVYYMDLIVLGRFYYRLLNFNMIINIA